MSGPRSTTARAKSGDMETWKECAWAGCRKRFEPGRRSNQHQHADGPRHGGAIYCSHRCRQMAYRWRVEASQKTTTHGSVTRPPQHIESATEFLTKNEHARSPFYLPEGCTYSQWEPWPPSHWRRITDANDGRPSSDDLTTPNF